MTSNRLSKSQYLKGRRCTRRVWLYQRHRELMQPTNEIQEAIFEQGHEVGRLAQQLFPQGLLISEDYQNLAAALTGTQKALKVGTPALFEAAFEFDGILVRADMMVKNPDGSWVLYEVKSTTKVKKEHYADTAIQAYVLQNVGIQLSSSNLVYLNSDFVRQGPIAPQKLFVIEPLDDNEKFKEAMLEILTYLREIREALTQDDMPEQMLGAVCKSPYECEFKHYCWGQIPDDSIHYLTRITDKKRKALLDIDIETIGDIPDDFELTGNQTIQVHAEQSGHAVIDRAAITEHLQKLVYPLWFLDFETYGFAIPAYDGTHPYEHLPFQFSLHVQQEQNGPVTHHEFLHDVKSDPRRAIADALCSVVGEQGSVVAYHASFERGRIEELARLFPEVSVQLKSMIERMWDLEEPFASRAYCHPDFCGRSSIKKVLPFLVPELSYDNMEIGRGDMAQLKYTQMLDMLGGSPEREKIKMDLLEYCGQDTLAMVKILEVLKQQIGP